MTRYKNQRELDEMAEDEFQEADKNLANKDVKPKETVDWEKRYSDLRRHDIEKENRYKAELAERERQIEGFKNGTLKPPKTKEEIEAWKSEYPDFGDLLESWMSQVVEDKTKNLKNETLKIKRERALLDLIKLVPDAEDIISQGSPFHDWLADRSDLEKQKIYNSFDIKSAAAILKNYKAETGKGSKSEMDEDLDPRDAARSVRTRSDTRVNADSDGFLFSESQIEEMTKRDPRWWDANEDKILEAQRQNKVRLDLSGGARSR